MKRWLGLLLALSATQVSAAEKWRLATAELPPAISATAAQNGYYAQLLRRILKELDAEPEFVFLPPSRVLQELRDGQVDGAFPLIRTPQREAEFLFAEPFYRARVRVFVSAAHGEPPADVQVLRGKTGCVPQGAKSPQLLQREIDAGRVRLQQGVGQLGTCFRMLQLGRVDFVVAGENGGWAAARELEIAGLRLHMANFVLGLEDVHLAFPRKSASSQARLRRFNEALQRLRASGELARLEARLRPPLRPPTGR